MTMQQKSSTSMAGQSDGQVTVDALDVSRIKSIETATGWTDVSDCSLVQFAVGEAHSPVSTPKLYPTLRYRDADNRWVRTPLSNVLSFSEEAIGAHEGSYSERTTS